MAKAFKKWEIPPSYDLGIPPYFHNIFKKHPLIKGYLRERLAHMDSSLDPDTYKAFEEQELPKIPLSEQPNVGQDTVFGMFRRCGLNKELEESINAYIRHLAYNHTDPVNLFRLKEFVAFCGVDGVYDLHQKRHFRIPTKTSYMPLSIIPSEWREEKDIPRIRRQMALMVDENNDLNRMREELSQIENKLWSGFRQQTMDRIANGLPVNSFNKDLKRRAKYLKENPHLMPLHDEWEVLQSKREKMLTDLMDTYAPMDEQYVLPDVKPEFDHYWDRAADKQVDHDQPLREKYEAYWLKQGLDWRDDDYVPYSHSILRQRTFTIKDWALRDYTLNEVNRTSYVDMRRHDLPRAFVDTVKAEIEDGMLSICDAPNRIEKVPGQPGQYFYIVNNCEAGTFSLDEVHELERSFEENEGITATDANGFLLTGRRNPKQRDPALGKDVRDGSNLANVSVDPDALLALLEADDDEGITKLIMDSAARQNKEAELKPGGDLSSTSLPSLPVVQDDDPVPSETIEGERVSSTDSDQDESLDEEEEDGFIVSLHVPPPEKLKPLTQADLPFPDVPLDLTEDELKEELAKELANENNDEAPNEETALDSEDEPGVSFGRTNSYRPKFGEEISKRKDTPNKGKNAPLGREMKEGGIPIAYGNKEESSPPPLIDPGDYLLAHALAPVRGLKNAAKAGLSAGTKGLSSAHKSLTSRKRREASSSDDRSTSRAAQYRSADEAIDKLTKSKEKEKPLSKAERMTAWGDLKTSMGSIETEIAEIAEKGDKVTDKELRRARQLKNLSSRISRSAMDTEKENPEEEELAGEIQKKAEMISKSIEKLIEAIMRLLGFGKDR